MNFLLDSPDCCAIAHSGLCSLTLHTDYISAQLWTSANQGSAVYTWCADIINTPP